MPQRSSETDPADTTGLTKGDKRFIKNNRLFDKSKGDNAAVTENTGLITECGHLILPAKPTRSFGVFSLFLRSSI